MIAEFFPLSTLKSLITHHIALIDRSDTFNAQEFALMYLKMENIDDLELKKSIQIVFRDSDIIFDSGKNYIILLPKTNWNGAYELLHGLQEFLNQELQDSIVTYPDDGEETTELIESFKSVVKKYYQIELTL
ncbi:MAG TPA: hypothetical protein EYH01_02945 [Campylobacterales bacterium]|nr:hypothetical protein [Campylobacterales bacterium]HIP59367.1 hypothetical protein [Campylobacterales bacterium]